MRAFRGGIERDRGYDTMWGLARRLGGAPGCTQAEVPRFGLVPLTMPTLSSHLTTADLHLAQRCSSEIGKSLKPVTLTSRRQFSLTFDRYLSHPVAAEPSDMVYHLAVVVAPLASNPDG